MESMFLPDVEAKEPSGLRGGAMRAMRDAGVPLPQILHLFAFKPAATDRLLQYTQEVMRGPSPLPAGMRELIAAFTSSRNQCPF